MLLVIDNCEHVISSVEAITVALLQSCPGLAVLATSRERLAVAGEAVYPLAPLPVPSAVDLFLQRVGTSPSRATDEQLALVAAICRRLDGIPRSSSPRRAKSIPSWAVLSENDLVIPLAEQQFMYERAKSKITRVEAGHTALISHTRI